MKTKSEAHEKALMPRHPLFAAIGKKYKETPFYAHPMYKKRTQKHPNGRSVGVTYQGMQLLMNDDKMVREILLYGSGNMGGYSTYSGGLAGGLEGGSNAEDYRDLQCFMQAINEPLLYCAVPDFHKMPDLKFDISKSHTEFLTNYMEKTNDVNGDLGMRLSAEGFWYGQSGDWAIVSDLLNKVFIVGLNWDAALNFKADFPGKYFDAHEHINRETKINRQLGYDFDHNDPDLKAWIEDFIEMYG
jgi:hypothetical protein